MDRRPGYVRFFMLLMLSASILLPRQTEAQHKERYGSIKETLRSSNRLNGSPGPRKVNWIDGGDRYSYIRYNGETQGTEIRVNDPGNGKDTLIFNNRNHTFPGSEQPFQYESFQWSGDSGYLLFQSNLRSVYRHSGISDYYYYSIHEQTLKLVAKDARTAALSPDGSKVGFERGGELFVHTLATGKQKQLTHSADEELVYNGRFGWVYEEEFGLTQAWMWSPDGSYIAFWKTDEREVPIFTTTDFSGQQPDYIEIPYPKVGAPNPKVRIGVIDVAEGTRHWMDIDADGGYIPRLYWTAREDRLGIVHLNRKQNHVKLFFHDVHSGEGRLVMSEQSETWIDVFSFFAGMDHLFFFPEDRNEFFWISDHDGWSHIYRYDYKGNLLNRVTGGEWEVKQVHAVDARNRRILYTSTEASPLERHLYSVSFDGKHKKRLTKAPGTHKISMGNNAEYFIDRYSNTETPLQVELRDRDGKLLKKLEDNKQVTFFIENHVYAPRELFSFFTSDGQQLDGYMIKPIDFDPDKIYPLILDIYGGPGAQGATNEFETSSWHQYLAQEGYVIVDVNNRGSGGYGSAFKKVVYQQLGKWEAHDFVETAQWMGKKKWIDENRMAILGHSYGGYMSCLTMLLYPDMFRIGIAGAPVTDWRLYDTIYAERYMGLIEDNTEGYKRSSPQTHADSLEGDLMIVHSAMDENVHLQNTMQLITALTNAGKDADLRIYPPGEHGVYYNPASYYLLYETYLEYLDTHLKQTP